MIEFIEAKIPPFIFRAILSKTVDFADLKSFFTKPIVLVILFSEDFRDSFGLRNSATFFREIAASQQVNKK